MIDDATDWHNEFVPDECEYGLLDLLALPYYGRGYFSLADASLLAALDEWWQSQDLLGDPDFWSLISDTDARERATPRQRVIQMALVNGVKQGKLDGNVFARDITSLDPLPEKTYASLSNIKSFLRNFNLGAGHLMEVASSIDDDGLYEFASAIARRRGAIRIGVEHQSENDQPSSDESVEFLKSQVESSRLRIRELESKIAALSSAVKPIDSRQRESYLNIIGALLAMFREYKCTEADIKRFIIDNRYSEIRGVSLRNLEIVFPSARKSIGEER